MSDLSRASSDSEETEDRFHTSPGVDSPVYNPTEEDYIYPYEDSTLDEHTILTAKTHNTRLRLKNSSQGIDDLTYTPLSQTDLSPVQPTSTFATHNTTLNLSPTNLKPIATFCVISQAFCRHSW